MPLNMCVNFKDISLSHFQVTLHIIFYNIKHKMTHRGRHQSQAWKPYYVLSHAINFHHVKYGIFMILRYRVMIHLFFIFIC